MDRPPERRWCHRAVYADRTLDAHPGPLLAPRLDPSVRAFWTIATVIAVVAAAGAVVTILAAAVTTAGLEDIEPLALAAFVACFALGPPGLAAWYFGVIRPRLRRRVLAARGRLCVTCGHNLSGRPARAPACPECGRPLARRDAVIYWCRFLLG